MSCASWHLLSCRPCSSKLWTSACRTVAFLSEPQCGDYTNTPLEIICSWTTEDRCSEAEWLTERNEDCSERNLDLAENAAITAESVSYWENFVWLFSSLPSDFITPRGLGQRVKCGFCSTKLFPRVTRWAEVTHEVMRRNHSVKVGELVVRFMILTWSWIHACCCQSWS